MDEQNISRRTLLAAAAGAVGTTMLPSPSRGYDDVARDANANAKAGKVSTRAPDVLNATAFGAKGDGITLDTAAVQAAIDTCNKDQGGTVLVPAGVFVIGTIEMKSNITLHIAAQGKLLGTAALELELPLPPNLNEMLPPATSVDSP